MHPRHMGNPPRIGLLALLLAVLAAPPASAGRLSIMIDGDLTDLEATLAANAGPEKGGFATDDAMGDRYAGSCAIVNGFDMRRFIALTDFRKKDGSISDHIDLYLGFRQDGIVGDTDGDGSPDVVTPGSPGIALHCTTGDQAGIGGAEFYAIQFDTDCDGLFDDFSLGVTNNQVAVIDPNTGEISKVIADGKFCFKSGNCATGTPLSTLEIFIPNIARFFPSGSDPYNFRFIGFSGARNDGPGEDTSDRQFTFSVPPAIAVDKAPRQQTAGPEGNASWNISVTNKGLSSFEKVAIVDTLGTGATFVNAVPSPSSLEGQVVTWNLANLARGRTTVIHVTVQLRSPCAGPILSKVTAEGTHLGRCLPPEGQKVFATARAELSCPAPTGESPPAGDPIRPSLGSEK